MTSNEKSSKRDDGRVAANELPKSEVQPTVQTRKIDRKMLELLVCPVTKTTLSYNAKRQELISTAARLAYPIRNGIPIMLPDEARRLDE